MFYFIDISIYLKCSVTSTRVLFTSINTSLPIFHFSHTNQIHGTVTTIYCMELYLHSPIFMAWCLVTWTTLLLPVTLVQCLVEQLIFIHLIAKLSALLWKSKGCHIVYRSPQVKCFQNQLNSDLVLTPYFLKRSILILYCSFQICLGLPSGLFLIGFPVILLCAFLISPVCAICCTHIAWFI
jgi:hypothetical protein